MVLIFSFVETTSIIITVTARMRITSCPVIRSLTFSVYLIKSEEITNCYSFVLFVIQVQNIIDLIIDHVDFVVL